MNVAVAFIETICLLLPWQADSFCSAAFAWQKALAH
jgi:hypothetical protein